MEENRIRMIIEQVDKFKLIDILSSVFYYFRVIGEYEEMITPVELEYMINFIYKTESKGKRIPTTDEIMVVLELVGRMLLEKEKEEREEDIIFTQAKADFLYVKEDTEYEAMVFEYLNLFNPVEHFFKTCYSFKIEDFLHFTAFIQIEYVNRMRLLDKVLKKSNEKVTKEILIDYLINCNCNILNFNAKTLGKSQEDRIAFSHILNKFSTEEEQCMEHRVERYPILKKENTYILSSIVSLLNKAKYIFEKEIYKDKILRNVYADKKGEYLEILTQNVIGEILKGAEIFPNIQYRENKMDRECDLLVMYDQIILIIEIKGRALKEVSKKGNKQYLEQDLEDNIYKAYKQATRMEKYLKENKNVSLRFGKEKGILKIEHADRFKIFKIGITLENFRKYAIQYTEFSNHAEHDMLFLSINDLKFMANYFKHQTEFIHYISQRIKTNQYIKEFYLYDELYLFSEYKVNNLQSILNNNHAIKIYDKKRYQLFDLRFDTEKKEQILRGRMHPLFHEIIRQLELKKMPTYSLAILTLLDIDYKSQEYIGQQLYKARLKFKEEGETIHLALELKEERDSKGIHLVLGVTDEKNQKDSLEGIAVLGSTLKRRYPNYEVIGILNNIENEEYEITECMSIREPNPSFDKVINKIEELKELYTNI